MFWKIKWLNDLNHKKTEDSINKSLHYQYKALSVANSMDIYLYESRPVMSEIVLGPIN